MTLVQALIQKFPGVCINIRDNYICVQQPRPDDTTKLTRELYALAKLHGKDFEGYDEYDGFPVFYSGA